MASYKQKRVSKWAALSILVLVVLLSACSGNTGTNESNAEKDVNGATKVSSNEGGDGQKLDPETLNWYYVSFSGQPSDVESVEAEVNKITQQAINTTVKLTPIDYGNYEDKMNTSISANENMDLIWTSSWALKYQDQVNKGAFMELTDDMLSKYAPTVKNSFPGFAWDDVRIGGKIYAVPNWGSFAKTPGFVIQKRFVDKYKLDISKIQTYKDLEPFFEQLKAGEPDIIPFGMGKDQTPLHEANGMSYYGGIHYELSDPHKAVDPYMTEGYVDYLKLMRDWMTKGYINKDAATIDESGVVTSKGNVAVIQDFSLSPGAIADLKSSMGGNDVVYVPIAETVFGGVQGSMNAIYSNSKHPERALMLLELVNTNKELFRLLAYGIEGKHYQKIDDTFIKKLENSGYSAQDWVLGNSTNGYLEEGQPADTYDQIKKLNEIAKASPINGFNWNSDEVKTELANYNSIVEEYGPGLETGTIDPAKYLPDVIGKLKDAGMDKILQSKQKQLDEWLKANGKS